MSESRLAINFQATEALDSTIQYEGTLDELDITADRRTFSSLGNMALSMLK